MANLQCRAAVRGGLVMVGLALPVALGAQRPVVATAGFTPAARVLFQTDFSADPLGSFPATLRHTRGPLEVVDVGGTRLLRSSGPSEFVIPLGAPLPQDFTLEFDLLPRAARGAGGEEFTFEGGLVKDESPGSAHVLWNQTLTRVIGGGADPFQVLLPEDLRGEFAGGQPVLIQAMVSGPSLKVFINGRQLHNLPTVRFRRASFLRVSLGGVNDGAGAVYLARIRVATNAGPPGTPTPTPPPGAPNSGSSTGANTGAPPTGGQIQQLAGNQATLGLTAGAPLPQVGPVNLSPALRGTAQCAPGAPTAPPPWWFGAGQRVGGAALVWMVEAGTEYLLERADAANPTSWTTLASTCNPAAPFIRLQVPWEDGNTYPTILLHDDFGGVQPGGRYLYRLTGIKANQTSGSATVTYQAQRGSFLAPPTATVTARDVSILTPVSYCAPLGERCDPTSVEFTVSSSTSGFAHSSTQSWVNNATPLDEPGTFTFTIPGVPSGVHTFTLTAIYRPAFRTVVGTVTVTVP